MKKIILNAIIFTVIFCAGILATYRVIRARTGGGALEAQTSDTLTATKRNEVVGMTADAWTVQSTNYIAGTSSRTNIPGMSQTITLKKDARVQIYTAGTQRQGSGRGQIGFKIAIDSTDCGNLYRNRTSATYQKARDTWSIICSIDLSAGDHTISTQIGGLSSTAPYICGSNGNHIACKMNIQAFYN